MDLIISKYRSGERESIADRQRDRQTDRPVTTITKEIFPSIKERETGSTDNTLPRPRTRRGLDAFSTLLCRESKARAMKIIVHEVFLFNLPPLFSSILSLVFVGRNLNFGNRWIPMVDDGILIRVAWKLIFSTKSLSEVNFF